jgi:dihydroflavonol-4-reductase
MKVFVTGATGFIGSHLVRRLVQDGHDIVCLVRSTSNVDHLEKLGAALFIGDVTKKETVAEGMQGCDCAVNLANVYSFWDADRRIYRRINVDGTRNVMQAALQSGAARVVHVSTLGIYGNTADRPITEESRVGPVRTSEYARSKYAGDLIAWEMHEKQGLPLVVIYPSVVLGPGDPKSSGQYIKRLLDGQMPAVTFEDKVYPFVHVNDVAEAIVRALEKKDTVGHKYIIGKHHHSMREINQMIAEISATPLPKLRLPGFLTALMATVFTAVATITKRPPPWDMSRDQVRSMKESIMADGSKAEKELGIEYTPIRIAIEEAIASYQGAPPK